MSLYDVNGNKITDTEYYSVEDKKQFPSYYGLDIDNNIRNGVTVPNGLNRLPKENLTMIAPTTYPAYNHPIMIYGDTFKQYNSSHSIVYVNDVAYAIDRWELADLPSNPNKWTITLSVTTQYYSNATTWFVQDMPLEEINAEFIANECVVASVTESFAKAVTIANKSDSSTVDVSTLKGKTWLALGDSYTHFLGASYTDGVTSCTTGKFGELANELGMTLYGYGISSSTIRYSKNTGNDGYSFQPMVSRVDTLIADHQSEADNVGLITFMGGVNDSWADTYLGNLKSLENTTIYGSCHQIFNKLVKAFPKAKIVVILQPCSANSTPPTDGEFSGFDDAQFCTYSAQLKQRIVKEVAEFYGLVICDCCFDWYSTTNPNHLSTIWGSDKLHLTTLGNQRLVEKLIKTLEETFV